MKQSLRTSQDDADSAVLKVTSSIDEAAEEIVQRSFCVFQPSPAVITQINRSRSEALKILDQPTRNLESLNETCHRIFKGSLHGFHIPSQAKRLFRAFPSSASQPWPNEDFQSSSIALASSLHDILVAIVKKLQEMSNSTEDQAIPHSIQKSLQPDSEMSQPSRKRKRKSDDSSAKSSSGQLSPETCWNIPTEIHQTTKCPMDYFFYHNRIPEAVNCSEHVDRGALICVCLSSASAGLEVLPRGENDFVCPEAILLQKNDTLEEEQNSSSGLICVMAGDQLGAMVGMERIACVHRVRNNLARARLSISYELRL